RIVGDSNGLEVHIEEAFLERGFGEWEGLKGEEIRRHWPHEHADWRDHRGGHGLVVEGRPAGVDRLAYECIKLVAENTSFTVMVMAHGPAITLGITEMLGLETSGCRGISGLENCHRSVIEPLAADTSGQLMRLVSHNLPPDFIGDRGRCNIDESPRHGA